MDIKSNKKILILGAGISGLGAAYSCKEMGYAPIVLEKDSTYGGLCGSFEIEGFTFDRFVHLSFSDSKIVNEIFLNSVSEVITHIPNPYNLYNRKWIKHPAQNNLFPLDEDEKQLIIRDLLKRPSIKTNIDNYEDWLRVKYGNYFAEHFPMAYTPKYWMIQAKELRTEWIGKRLYQPSVEEVMSGARNPDTPVTFYAQEMRYPKKGGYKSFLKSMTEKSDIRYNETVQRIDPVKKIVHTSSGKAYCYDDLFSSIPLPEMTKIVDMVPKAVKSAANHLKYTSGYHISVGLKTKNIPPFLWWYIYDKDILAARVYSPSLKSPNNAPIGCSSLQLEVYCNKEQFTKQELYDGTVKKLADSSIIDEQDIMFVEMRFEKYANVIFNKTVYENREIVKKYLSSIDIKPFGRFGEWDYLWSDQSLLSGINVIGAC
jgi:protoporphyrinogen oxidase